MQPCPGHHQCLGFHGSTALQRQDTEDVFENLVREYQHYTRLNRPLVALWQHAYDVLNQRIAAVRLDSPGSTGCPTAVATCWRCRWTTASWSPMSATTCTVRWPACRVTACCRRRPGMCWTASVSRYWPGLEPWRAGKTQPRWARHGSSRAADMGRRQGLGRMKARAMACMYSPSALPIVSALRPRTFQALP